MVGITRSKVILESDGRQGLAVLFDISTRFASQQSNMACWKIHENTISFDVPFKKQFRTRLWIIGLSIRPLRRNGARSMVYPCLLKLDGKAQYRSAHQIIQSPVYCTGSSGNAGRFTNSYHHDITMISP